jgi:dGTPase
VEEMNWEKLLSRKRLGKSETKTPAEFSRTIFEADIQRVIFSSAFRRLSKKTQVHPLIANDHVHTRLTHSLEVSQVGKILGKTLGQRIKLPESYTEADLGAIVEAACLAHDLGNPPFGHAGEEAMRHWFDANGPDIFGSLSKKHKHDLLTFEGNAQGFRILTQTENHVFQGGMRLTYATLGSFMKYPWTSEKPGKKFGVFISEEAILKEVATEVGLIKKSNHEWARHPLAYLVEAADDICYGILDLEDAAELKIISFSDVSDVLMKVFDKTENDEIKNGFASKSEFRVNLSRLRGRIFEKAISGAIDGFMLAYNDIMRGSFKGDVFSALADGDPRKTLISSAKALALDNIYPDANKVEIELGSYATFETLLATFCTASIENSKHIQSPKGEHPLGWKSELVLKMLGAHAPNATNAPIGSSWSEYQCLRRAIDYVSGMTDNYAVYVASQIQGTASSNGLRH